MTYIQMAQKGKNKTRTKPTKNKEDWHYCHKCQIKRGGKVPKGGHKGITVTVGKCSMCGDKGVMLIPNADYVWKGKQYLWD